LNDCDDIEVVDPNAGSSSDSPGLQVISQQGQVPAFFTGAQLNMLSEIFLAFQQVHDV
jgi:hypothetical protein